MEPEKFKNLTQSFSTNTTLPEVLITDILSRLPVKSLLRFESVSKSWLALISSPEFIKTHLSVSANNKDYTRHTLLIKRKPEVREDHFNAKGLFINPFFDGHVTEAFDFDYTVNRFWIYVEGSVNGLVCFSYGKGDFYLWNPSIRTLKKLPDLIISVCKYISYNNGFGYDEVHDDYKLVSVVSMRRKRDDEEHVVVRVYSLKSDTWRSLDDLRDGLHLLEGGFQVNGKLNWSGVEDDEQVIVYFDLADEKWGMVERPRGERCKDFYLGVLGCDLCAIYNEYHYINGQHRVWVMKEYGVRESWTKLYTMKYPNLAVLGPISICLSPPFFMSKEGELLVVSGHAITIYNPEDDCVRYVELPYTTDNVMPYIYIESLVCPLLLSKRITKLG